jgi:CNT family concentrative nucleoside transporter
MLTNSTEYADLNPRSTIIATYSLCGFGNIGSLGTQIGVLSQLAPGRAGDVSKLAISALITGVLSTLSSASIAGLVIQDQENFQTVVPTKRAILSSEIEAEAQKDREAAVL